MMYDVIDRQCVPLNLRNHLALTCARHISRKFSLSVFLSAISFANLKFVVILCYILHLVLVSLLLPLGCMCKNTEYMQGFYVAPSKQVFDICSILPHVSVESIGYITRVGGDVGVLRCVQCLVLGQR